MGRPSKYTSEFRREALELVRPSGRPIVEVVRSLGMNDGTLGNWVKVDREAVSGREIPRRCRSLSGKSSRGSGREVTELRVDREVLRKACTESCEAQLGGSVNPDGSFLRKGSRAWAVKGSNLRPWD